MWSLPVLVIVTGPLITALLAVIWFWWSERYFSLLTVIVCLIGSFACWQVVWLILPFVMNAPGS